MKYLTIVLLAFLFIACSEEKPADEQQTMKEPEKKSEKNSQPQVYDDNVTDFLLKLKMKSGDNYILKIGREEKITQSSGSQKQSAKQTEKFDYSFSILEVKDNGDFTAEIRFDRIIKEFDAGQMGKQSFDSKNSGKSQDAPPEVLIFQNMIGMKYQIEVSADGKVKKVTGSDKLVNAALKGLTLDKQPLEFLKQGLKQEFSEKQLADYYEKLFNYLDGKPKQVGDTWEKSYKIQAGMPLNVKTKYEITEMNNDKIIINTSSVLNDKAGKQTKEIQNIKVTFEVKGDQEGKIELDRTTGFILNSSVNQTISAKETRVLVDSATKNTQSVVLESLKEANYSISAKKK